MGNLNRNAFMKKNKKPIDSLNRVMARLRDQLGGCPWDIEQTFASIAPYTIEEAYEVSDAIERKDMCSLREELGDLLFQVVFHSRIAEESGYFNFDEVVENIIEKMIRRHPHVFGEEGGRKKEFQLEDWEAQKKKERADKARSRGVNHSILDDVPISFPALKRAEKLGKRIARAGFEWLEIDLVFNKLNEEIDELRLLLEEDGFSQKLIEEELGNILLTIVSLARHMRVDPELALRRGNAKFERRFRFVENQLRNNRKKLEEIEIEEFELLWEKAK